MNVATSEASNAEPTEAEIIASFGSDEDTSPPALDPNPKEGAAEDDGEPQLELEAEPNPNDEPPEFWSAERKALWAKVTDPELRAAIRGHVDDASKAISGKMEEAAKARREAEEKATRFEAERAQSVAWWQHAGPALQRVLEGRWAGWTPEYQTKLAEENPAEYTRLKAQFDAETAQFSALRARQEHEAAELRKTQESKFNQERAVEHEKLAKRYPEFAADKAQATYDTLSKYLLDQGISPERLKGIYEEPVVATVLKAYKYDQLRAKAGTVTTPRQPAQPASTTPRRIAPGAARAAANQGSDSERQALERLRSGDSSEEVLRMAFR